MCFWFRRCWWLAIGFKGWFSNLSQPIHRETLLDELQVALTETKKQTNPLLFLLTFLLKKQGASMEIVTYRKLRTKNDFMMLMDLAFSWPMSPSDFEERIKTDIRLKDSPVGFCAVQDGQLAGFVGVMDIPTRTAQGEIEFVGGIYCVATNPAFARQGISKTLLDVAHIYFHSQKYLFSFLCTSRTIIAYALYRKLGYVEVDAVNQYAAAYKTIDKTEPVNLISPAHIDPPRIYQIYERYIKERVGFAVRQKDFFTIFAKRKRFDEQKTILKEKGYALLTEEINVIRVQDLVALDHSTYAELVEEVERTAKRGVINRSVVDKTLLDIYQTKGYRVQKGDHGVLMVRNLSDVAFEGVYGKSFYMGLLDWF